ncbi:hypothetical protein [Kineococcus sp. G2]|uniref:hypothetical protein n=1 Tax=Kineococcus sp. G2 TaxID=3127484 RepID=UPI00301E2FF2
MGRRTTLGAAATAGALLLGLGGAQAATPDGPLLAFTGYLPGAHEMSLLTVDTVTGAQHEVAAEPAQDVSWSPDGTRLAWIGYGAGPDGAEVSRAVVAGTDGTGRRELGSAGGWRSLDWGADGTLAWLRAPADAAVCEDPARLARLDVVLRAADGTERVLTTAAATAFDLRFSPDASRLVWRERGDDPCRGVDSQVRIADVATGSVVQVSGEAQRGGFASFTPDGSTIVLAKSDGVGADLVLVDVATATSRRLVTPGIVESHPAVSPDGSTLAVLRQEQGAEATVALLDLDGTFRRDVAPAPDLTEALAWSPRGDSLLVSGSRSYPACPGCDYGTVDPAVWRVGLDGTQTVLSEDGVLGSTELVVAPWFPETPVVQRRTRAVR